MVRRFEPQHEYGPCSLSDLITRHLGRIEQPAVRRIQSGLTERTDGGHAGLEASKAHRSRSTIHRAILKPHPRFSDDAKDTLRANEHTVRAGARAGAGQTPRGDSAARRDDTERFDEVVNVGVQRGKMAA